MTFTIKNVTITLKSEELNLKTISSKNLMSIASEIFKNPICFCTGENISGLKLYCFG